MVKYVFTALLLLATLRGTAQINWNSILDKKKKLTAAPLTNDEVVRGLREALTVGSKTAAGKASKTDGYFKNPKIKIPFPPEAVKMESTLRNLGMRKEVDRFVMTMNRAAEDAARKAAPIFADAITSMSLSDGMTILKGKDDAATRYLQSATGEKLRQAFMPVVKASIDKVEVTRYWSPLATAYNKVPFVTRVNPDLEDYITRKAIDGLFVLLAEEEARIRKDPAARITDLLKKVFGGT